MPLPLRYVCLSCSLLVCLCATSLSHKLNPAFASSPITYVAVVDWFSVSQPPFPCLPSSLYYSSSCSCYDNRLSTIGRLSSALSVPISYHGTHEEDEQRQLEPPHATTPTFKPVQAAAGGMTPSIASRLDRAQLKCLATGRNTWQHHTPSSYCMYQYSVPGPGWRAQRPAVSG